MSYYPVLLDLRDKKALVVGGGKVAQRKIDSLLEHGAAVHVVARNLTDTLCRYAKEGRVRRLGSEFSEDCLKGFFLVIAATDDPLLNKEISERARSKGLLVNAVDQPLDCNFILPSVLRRGDLLISVSTSGRSPALAKKVREDLEHVFGDEYAALLMFMGRIRKEVLSRGLSGAENKRIFSEFVHSSLLESLREKDWEGGVSIVNGILGSTYSAGEFRKFVQGE